MKAWVWEVEGIRKVFVCETVEQAREAERRNFLSDEKAMEHPWAKAVLLRDPSYYMGLPVQLTLLDNFDSIRSFNYHQSCPSPGIP